MPITDTSSMGPCEFVFWDDDRDAGFLPQFYQRFAEGVASGVEVVALCMPGTLDAFYAVSIATA